jgi:succinate dehydrogenase/fumarate reductase flavoprotein subunit
MKKSDLQQIIREELQLIREAKEAKDINSLIKKLRQDLDKIRKEYEGKLTRNTIKDEFKEQIGKI